MTDDDLPDLDELYADLVRQKELTRAKRLEAKAKLAEFGVKGVQCRLFMNLVSVTQREMVRKDLELALKQA